MTHSLVQAGVWALSFVALVLAIILHEVAHGYAALALGDDTARRAGRLSLNPIRHVDRVGTILLPALFLILQVLTRLGGGIFFGWAKPVPVNPMRFANPRRGMAVVALAGPLANYALAYLSLLALHLTPALPGLARLMALVFLGYFLMANIALATFNLLPLPPLDGGRVAVGILPLPLARVWARLERAGIAIVLIAALVLPSALREAGIPFNPLGAWLEWVGDPAFEALDGLAGHPRDLGFVLHFLGAE